MSTAGSPSSPGYGSSRTRVVHLDQGQRRRGAENHRTVVGPIQRIAPRKVPFEALFFAHYDSIRRACRGASESGVAVIAVHAPTRRLAGRLWLRAHLGRPASAIIGRHARADLMLTDDCGLSLRHLALVMHPLRSWDGGDARFTVLDLRTGRAFHDEEGRHLEGVRCEGPALLSCGEYALYFLQTGDATDWPRAAGDAWSMLPERIYLEERGAEPDRWERRANRPRKPRRQRCDAQTLITAIRGPIGADEELIADGEAPLGALNILTADSARRLIVGAAAAGRGILLGRYGRCDGADLLGADVVSRTHLLLLSVERAMYAFDTASTHGSFVDRRRRGQPEFRALALDRDTGIVLADEGAVVRWHPAR